MNLTATDRKALIRLASNLPAGSEERKAILAGLKQSSDEVFVPPKAEIQRVLNKLERLAGPWAGLSGVKLFRQYAEPQYQYPSGRKPPATSYIVDALEISDNPPSLQKDWVRASLPSDERDWDSLVRFIESETKQVLLRAQKDADHKLNWTKSMLSRSHLKNLRKKDVLKVPAGTTVTDFSFSSGTRNSRKLQAPAHFIFREYTTNERDADMFGPYVAVQDGRRSPTYLPNNPAIEKLKDNTSYWDQF